MCFDGAAPQVKMHMVLDGREADHHEANASHRDQVIHISHALAGKGGAPDVDEAMVLALVLVLLAAPVRRLIPEFSPIRSSLSPPFLRPPLRGPPH
jgi:hypothetical protein